MFVLSSSLQCLYCCAAFDYFGEEGTLTGQACTYCGSDLIELPETVTSEPAGFGLREIRPPFDEMRLQASRQLDPDLMPRLVKQEVEDSVLIRHQDLAALAGELDIHVEVRAFGSHKSPTIGRWEASLLELNVDHSDIGLDAALVGLTNQVSARVTQLLAQDCLERESKLKLLLGLWLEDQTGRLGTILESSAVLINWEYELDAC